MTNNFLEEQAKARGITVSEMMRQRGALAKRRGFAGMSPEKRQEIQEKGRKSRAKKQETTES